MTNDLNYVSLLSYNFLNDKVWCTLLPCLLNLSGGAAQSKVFVTTWTSNEKILNTYEDIKINNLTGIILQPIIFMNESSDGIRKDLQLQVHGTSTKLILS